MSERLSKAYSTLIGGAMHPTDREESGAGIMGISVGSLVAVGASRVFEDPGSWTQARVGLALAVIGFSVGFARYVDGYIESLRKNNQTGHAGLYDWKNTD